MPDRNYKTPETTIYRQIGDELVVVQLDTADYYYFTPETKTVLEFFKSPQSLSTFCDKAGIKEKSDERNELKSFCQLLLQKQILKETKEISPESPKEKIHYRRAGFLREGDKKLDQISFGCP